MNPIQMVDLTTQYACIKDEIDRAILQVVRNGNYINGKEVVGFAEALSSFTGSNAIPCANGTDALQIALMALDLKPGDEVVVPAFTYAAAAEAIALLRLTPVPVDVDPLTYNIDIQKVEEVISPKTKAIIPVHLFGQTSDMAPVMEIAQKYGLSIIEDNAQSIGSVYTFPDGSKKQAGTIGDIGTLSFFPTKNLGCFGDGGAILSTNEKLIEKLQIIGKHGQSSKYHHRIIGCNSRLDTIQAAVLLVKLNYLEQYTATRRKTAEYYRTNLSVVSEFIELPYQAPYSTHVFNQFTIKVKSGKRDDLQRFLKEKGIPTVIYYPLPLHKQEAFRPIVSIKNDLSASETLCQTVLSLPIHTELNGDQQDYIIDQIIEFFN